MDFAIAAQASPETIVVAQPVMIAAPVEGVAFDTQLIAPLRRYWRAIAAVTAAFMILMLIQQIRSVPVYSAYAVLSPTNNANAGGASKLGRLANLAGIDLGGTKPASSFERFQFLLTSPQLAAYQIHEHDMLKQVFAADWDGVNHRWKRPDGVLAGLTASINPLFGLPAWTPPDARALAAHYERTLDPQKVPDTGLIRLVYKDTDPARAAQTLRLLIADGNEMLRRSAALYARAQAQYLRNRIDQTQVADYRSTLIDLLTEQEQTLLLSNGAMPFAAEQVEAVNVASMPTKRPLLYVMIAGVVGFSLAALMAIIVYNRRLYAPLATEHA